MRSPKNVHLPYTVEILTEAWEQVSYLPRDTYRAIQARLESLAQQTALSAAPEAGTGGAPSFQLDDLTIHYGVDPKRRLIQLLRISRERVPPAGMALREEPPH